MEGNSLLYVTTRLSLVAMPIVVVRGDKTFLIYHVTSRDHMFNGLCDLIGWSKLPLCYVPWP